MNNPKLEGIIDRFASFKKIEDKFAIRYEAFVNYLILKDLFYTINGEYPYESNLDLDLIESMHFGSNRTMAIDGCFIIYKKDILHLNLDDEEIDDKISSFNEGFLYIILIQTKTGKLDTNDLSSLTNCLDNQSLKQTNWEKFWKFRKKCEILLKNNYKIDLCFKYINVSGQESDQTIFLSDTFAVRVNALKSKMREFFWITKEDRVTIDFYSDKNILEKWEEQELNAVTITKTVEYVEITKEINIPNVGKILFGAITFGELMKIIYNKEKHKPNDLYGYNVRAEIEKSEIKPRIIKTIQENGDKFILLNNGITLIVDKQEIRGSSGIVLENIRIVNGCQTCHAILETCKENDIYNHLRVSIKIIETDKDEVLLGDITYSSNNQNPVTKENLISIHPKIVELEKYYKDLNISNKSSLLIPLFERRQGQYNNSSTNKIDMLTQSKAYICIWQTEPHKAAMYRDEVLSDYTNFRDNDSNFINKSLISGIFWFNIHRCIPGIYENARYQVFSTIVLYQLELYMNEYDILSVENLDERTLNIDPSWLINLHQNLNFKLEVDLVIKSITTVKDLNENLLFPPSNKQGRIHYRKFYPKESLSIIYNKYKELKNGIDFNSN